MTTIKSVREIITSPWKGSSATAELVREQLRSKYNDEIADSFDASKDAMPFASWLSYGYRVRKGEKALKSVTYVDVEDEDGMSEKKIRRNVNLFHKCQVEKIV